jgi:hypothetical protein
LGTNVGKESAELLLQIKNGPVSRKVTFASRWILIITLFQTLFFSYEYVNIYFIFMMYCILCNLCYRFQSNDEILSRAGHTFGTRNDGVKERWSYGLILSKGEPSDIF